MLPEDFDKFLKYEVVNNFWARNAFCEPMRNYIANRIAKRVQRKYKRYIIFNNHIENGK